jgi:hypothetical protein
MLATPASALIFAHIYGVIIKSLSADGLCHIACDMLDANKQLKEAGI